MSRRTRERFRDDAYATECETTVTAVTEAGNIVLDETVFYYTAGGQPGDTGKLIWGNNELDIVTTVFDNGEILHCPVATEADNIKRPTPGTAVQARIDWPRRHALMKMHSTLHLVMAVVPHQINGCQIGPDKSRIDFDTVGEKLDRQQIEDALNALVQADHLVSAEWADISVLAENPSLVRTMAVEPPSADGRIRLVRIGDAVDIQPCGGTHVRTTGEIGPLRVGKVDNKGARNKRLTVHLDA